MSEGEGEGARRLGLVLSSILAVALVVALWSVPYVPTHDGPNHIASCVLANDLGAPDSPLGRYLERGAPLSNLGFQKICEPLDRLLGWRAAYRVAITLIALIWALGYAYLASGLWASRLAPPPGGASPAFRLFGFATALPWAFYMGFFNFVLGSALSLWLMGFVVRRPRLGRLESIGLSASLLLVGVVHIFAAFLGAVGLAFVLVARCPSPREGVREVLRIAAIAVPAAGLAIALLADHREPGEPALAQDIFERIRILSETFIGGPWPRAWLFAALCIGAALRGVLDLIRGRLSPSQRGVALFSALSIIAFLLSPLDLRNWSYFSPRFLLVGLAIAPLGLATTGARRASRPLSDALVFSLSLGSISWSAFHHWSLEPSVREALSGIDAPTERGAPRLPLFFVDSRRDVAFAEPLVMIGQLYLLDGASVSPFLWADTPTVDAILFKDTVASLFGARPPRFVREPMKCAGKTPDCPPLDVQYEWYAIFGRAYRDVILFSDDPRALETFVSRGYAIDFQRDRLSIVHARVCHLDIVLGRATGASSLPLALRLRIGRAKIETPTTERIVSAGTAIPESGLLLSSEEPDCGSLWIALDFAEARAPAVSRAGPMDERGSTDPRSRSDERAHLPIPVCKEADSAGLLYTEVTPEQPSVVRCTLIPGAEGQGDLPSPPPWDESDGTKR